MTYHSSFRMYTHKQLLTERIQVLEELIGRLSRGLTAAQTQLAHGTRVRAYLGPKPAPA
ncbi:hypothetical protein GCM10027085_63630 [Spirosoma aerophilum]